MCIRVRKGNPEDPSWSHLLQLSKIARGDMLVLLWDITKPLGAAISCTLVKENGFWDHKGERQSLSDYKNNTRSNKTLVEEQQREDKELHKTLTKYVFQSKLVRATCMNNLCSKKNICRVAQTGTRSRMFRVVAVTPKGFRIDSTDNSFVARSVPLKLCATKGSNSKLFQFTLGGHQFDINFDRTPARNAVYALLSGIRRPNSSIGKVWRAAGTPGTVFLLSILQFLAPSGALVKVQPTPEKKTRKRKRASNNSKRASKNSKRASV
jgi:hypothetical protein